MTKKWGKRAKFTLPGNMKSWEIVDLPEEEKEDDWEWNWALEDKVLNSSFDTSRAYDDDAGLQIALYESTQLRFSSTTRNEDSSKKIVHDVKKKGIYTGSIPLKTFGSWSGNNIRERGESSCTYCVICDDAKPTRSLIQSNCRHCFCEDCIRIYLGEKFQENILSVKCPAKDCKAFLEDIFWYHYVPEEVFDQWDKTFIESTMLASPKMIKCPVCFGEFSDDGRDFLIRACPKCWKIFCMKCRVPWQMNRSCDDIKFQFDLSRMFKFWKSRYVIII